MNNSKIAEERKKLGLSQAELATKLKVSQKSISKYECGTRRPSYETLLAMSSIFGVSVDYLIGASDIPISNDNLEWRYPPVSNRLGKILNNYREKERLSEQAISKALNITLETYINIEIGKYIPSLSLLQKISSITGYDIDYLTGAVEHTNILSNEAFKIGERDFPVLYRESDNHFKARFEELCISRGIDKTNSEKKIGLTSKEFIDISWNRMPTLAELLKISYAFGVSLDYLIGKTDIRLSDLSSDELELILNYRDCLPRYKENISKRAENLCIESIREREEKSVAADEELKKTGTDNLGK